VTDKGQINMAITTAVTAGRKAKIERRSLRGHLPTVGRVFLGLLFFVFGLFGLLTSLHLVPEPSAPMPAGALAFTESLKDTGYMVPLSSITELIVGALLLSNRFVPLALTLIAPVIVNIFLFHAILAPSGMGMVIVIVALEIYLAWSYRDTFRPMLAACAGPTTHRHISGGLS
jgi:hypothetical protein